jgi:hypothetical protein
MGVMMKWTSREIFSRWETTSSAKMAPVSPAASKKKRINRLRRPGGVNELSTDFGI